MKAHSQLSALLTAIAMGIHFHSCTGKPGLAKLEGNKMFGVNSLISFGQGTLYLYTVFCRMSIQKQKI